MADAAPPTPPGEPRRSVEDDQERVRRVRHEARAVREEFSRTRASIAETWSQLLKTRHGVAMEQEMRRAALNLLEDTERAEAAERASKVRLQLALDAAGMGTFMWFPQEDRAESDPRMLALFGLAPGDNISLAIALATLIHVDDGPGYAAAVARATDPAGNGTLEAEMRICRADTGEERWLSVRGQTVFAGDPPRAVRMSGVCADVTERKRSEKALRESQERWRLVVENAREYAIFSMTLDRVILSWNSGARQILGYTAEEAIGTKADFIFTPEDDAAGIPEAEALTAILNGRASDERWHVRKNGERFWGSGVMMAMHDEHGHAFGLVKVFRDHTEQMRVKEALEQSLQETERARAETEAAGKAKDHFLAVLSHELRTPLTPVLMATQTLARRKDLPERVQEALAMIRRNVQIESRFVDELLDITKIERGKMELVRDAMDVHEAIEHAVEVSRPDIEARSQRLTVALEARDHRLHGDFSRLQQVVWNLLKNSSKFTPEGGEIRVQTRNEAGQLVIEVIDSGIGIAPEAAARIFDPFTQADAAITREYGGLGLGLAIAKASVLGHGGEIRVESEGARRGAKFIVTLPLAMGESPRHLQGGL